MADLVAFLTAPSTIAYAVLLIGVFFALQIPDVFPVLALAQAGFLVALEWQEWHGLRLH